MWLIDQLFIELWQTSYKIKKLQISPILDYSIALTVACIRGPSFRLAVLTKISGFKGYRFSLLAAMVAVCKEIESFQKNLKSQEIPDMYMGKLDRAALGLACTEGVARILVDIKANLYGKNG